MTRAGIDDRWGFSVVPPQQQTAHNGSSCFNWFQSGDIARGRGEAARNAQMVDPAARRRPR